MDRFLNELLKRYPNGNLQLENEIQSLKRKLEDFSDSDEDLVSAANQIENEWNKENNRHIKKQKLQSENEPNTEKSETNKNERIHSKQSLTCEICGRCFAQKRNLTRHKLTHAPASFICSVCGKSFNRKDNLNTHKRRLHHENHHQEDPVPSTSREISSQIGGQAALSLKKATVPPTESSGQSSTSTIDRANNNSIHQTSNTFEPKRKTKQKTRNQDGTETALNNSIQDRTIIPNVGERYDLLVFFASVRSQIESFLKSRVLVNSIKFYMSVQVEMQRDNRDGDSVSRPHFRGETYKLLNMDTFNEHDLNESFQKMFQSFEAYKRESSGWVLKRVLHLKIHTVNYKPLGGSNFIDLPLTLKRSKCILNIYNDDNKCFLWSILAALHPAEVNPENKDHYTTYKHTLNLSNIDVPVPISQIDKFENQNQSISVNVFGLEGKKIIPLKITKNSQREHHVNLLLLEKDSKSHYCLIKNLNNFLSRTKKNKNQTFFCCYCLHGFTSEKLLNDHVGYCSVHDAQRVDLPNPKNNMLKFSDFEKTQEVPFIIYCDFETLNKPLSSCEPNPQESSSTKSKHLVPCGFAYKVVSIEPEYTKQAVVYRGSNVAEEFLNCLMSESADIQEKLGIIQPIDMNELDEAIFQAATECSICSLPFTTDDKKVRHHNHVLKHDNFIGAAHQTCNLKSRQMKFIPVLFHNLKHFDAHIICQAIGKFKDSEITCIPQNMENYISFSLGPLRFLDSFAFLPTSLDNLVQNLLQDGKSKFKHMQSEFPPTHLDLLLRKGIYPYDYVDDSGRFEEKGLPPKENFFSSLKKEHISDDDYSHAWRVFKELNLHTLGDYHDLYVKSDCLLLCDVFEQFRSLCLQVYGLDPAHFYTSPGLSWSAMLKMTKVCLELMTDIDMVLFIEKGIRGGISQISNRYKKANNPYLEDYDPSKPNSFLQYVDANALYSHAMSNFFLPTGMFSWLDDKEINELDIHKIKENGSTGYIFEVDLEYPEHLHTQHNSYPLAPEKTLIESDKLSPYAKRILKKIRNKADHENLPPLPKAEKLLTTLENKKNYVLHYRNLQLYLQLGLKLKKIHRVLKFYQEPFLEAYISLNTRLRQNSKSAFEKDLFKLLCNSVFGKTMENLRLHKDVHLCQLETQLLKLTAKATFKGHKIFSEDLAAIELKRAQVLLKKPCYIGMAILDLSKYHMYDFYYNYLQKIYPESLELQMTDTDSFLFYCETKDIFEDMEKHAHLFDFSNFDSNNFLYSDTNKKVVGKFKSETAEKCISEFVGLRSKLYAFLCNDEEEKRAKGINKITVKKDITFHHYKSALFDECTVKANMTSIRSHSHELFCENFNKTALSCFDDKRYLLDDGIKSLAYGHSNICV